MKQSQSNITIEGRSFTPLILKEYSLIFELLDLELTTLDSLPLDLLQRLIELVQSKALTDITDISPLDLLSVTYKFIEHHINLMQQHKRILSLDEASRQWQEQHVFELEAAGMPEDAEKLRQQLRSDKLTDKSKNRSYNKELAALQDEHGKENLIILQWCIQVAQSEICNKSVSDLLAMQWQEFISLSNQVQIVSNLSQAAQDDQKKAQQLAESQKQAQQRF
ncbi:hypothetical protein [Vibrio diazotrophicus]|uniref:hypothetical protein n=1 Tax=Vibrio diazotrophicus TaxID=685 RepID=UPI000C9EC450|nr:hypothetical protein [Vibrio diazotrophicus]PNH81340.1 hypothetical protein C1N27_07290 [Vibrio diazotrophicus]